MLLINFSLQHNSIKSLLNSGHSFFESKPPTYFSYFCFVLKWSSLFLFVSNYQPSVQPLSFFCLFKVTTTNNICPPTIVQLCLMFCSFPKRWCYLPDNILFLMLSFEFKTTWTAVSAQVVSFLHLFLSIIPNMAFSIFHWFILNFSVW